MSILLLLGPYYLWVFLALWCASYEFHNLKHDYSSLTSDFKFTSLLRCSNSLDCDWFLLVIMSALSGFVYACTLIAVGRVPFV